MLIKRFTETAVLPRRATEGSAGYDLSADLSQPEVIQPGESKLLPTGIGVVLPPQTAGLVFGRSGLGARHGIVPANAVGVIDWDYRGEIKVPLRNQGSEPYTVQPGDSLYTIARRFNTTVPRLVRLNRLRNPNRIYPGQVLRLR